MLCDVIVEQNPLSIYTFIGGNSLECLKRLTRSDIYFDSMQMKYAKIYNLSGQVMDDAMFCFMKGWGKCLIYSYFYTLGPKTFTGEDVAEVIHCKNYYFFLIY